MKRQLQHDESKIDGRGVSVHAFIQNRDTDPTTARLVEAETIEENNEFGHYILVRTQQNLSKMCPEGRSNKHTNGIGDARGVRKSGNQFIFKNNMS